MSRLTLHDFSLKVQMLSILALAIGMGMSAHRAIAYWVERRSFDETVLSKTLSLSELMGDIAAAALVFDEPASATDNLSKLATRQDVACAWLFDHEGNIFSVYEKEVPEGLEQKLRPAGGYFDLPGFLCVYDRIESKGEHIGTLCLVIDLSPSLDRFKFNNYVAAGSALVAVCFALIFAAFALRFVLGPVSSLSRAAREVFASQDYSIRAPLLDGRSEVAELIEVFNKMLAQIQLRDVAIHKSEKLLRGIIDHSTAGLSVKHADGTYVLVNRRFQEMHGVTLEAIRGKTDAAVFTTTQAGILTAGDKDVLTGKQSRTTEFEMSIAGEKRTFLSLKFPLLDADDNAFAVCDIATDITERIAALTALRESEARYKTLVEHAPEAVVVLDVDRGCFVESNSNARKLFGLSDSELNAVGPWDLSFPMARNGLSSSRDALGKIIQDVLKGKTVVEEWDFKSAAGQRVPCEMRWVRLPSEGRPLVRGSITDITERKALERQLDASQKLESIGRLAGGVAHDFNNILTAVMGCAEMCARTLPAGAPGHQKLEMLHSAAQRGATLSNQLLGYARKQVNHPVRLSINSVLGDMQPMLPSLVGEDIEMVFELDPNLQAVRFDSGQLEQIILNLVVNARDAMPDGGRLLFNTRNVDRHAIGTRAGPDLVAGVYVLFSIQDSGEGIAPELRSKIFEPFFTTKEVGKGTGLGLATCYGIVKQHGGEIYIHSDIGDGARFEIFLPAKGMLAKPVIQNASSGRSKKLDPVVASTTRILFVEDDIILRELGVDVLEEEGYQVVSAENGVEALMMVRGSAHPIHLVITDVIMPQMGGKELVAELKKDYPQLKIIFTSGYPREKFAKDGMLDGLSAFLNKPYLLDQLLEEIQRVLGEGRRTDRGHQTYDI